MGFQSGLHERMMVEEQGKCDPGVHVALSQLQVVQPYRQDRVRGQRVNCLLIGLKEREKSLLLFMRRDALIRSV